ncbi:RTX toxins and Ca2+-binding proteins-like protein [Oxalobacteraceae bacterium IMCC9480]|nr:RTX toxins and Ca2+-binding proteins-like protein [Oxalobacteraceae bacterium IMCC9480]
MVTLIVSTDTGTGGNDALRAGAGRNVLVGGAGDDSLVAGDGGNVIFGDNGQVTLAANGDLIELITISPTIGGNDIGRSGIGDDVLLGGNGNDELFGSDGTNIVIGDNAQVTYVAGVLRLAQTIDLYEGGDDILHGGSGLSVLFGGVGNDLLYGLFTQDVMVGDYGAITFIDGRAVSLVRFGSATNSPDLIASAQDVVFAAAPPASDSHETGRPGMLAAARRMEQLLASIAAPGYKAAVVDASTQPVTVVTHSRGGEMQAVAAVAPAQPGDFDTGPATGAGPARPQADPDCLPAEPVVIDGEVVVPCAAPVTPEAPAVAPESSGELNIALAGLVGAQALQVRSGVARQFDARSGKWLATAVAGRTGVRLDLQQAGPQVASATAPLAAVSHDIAGVAIVELQAAAPARRAVAIDWGDSLTDREPETTA